MIVGVCIRWGSYVISLPKPARHHDVIAAAVERAKTDPAFAAKYEARKSGNMQGFVDEHGQTYTRHAAHTHAWAHGQRNRWGKQLASSVGELDSDDMW